MKSSVITFPGSNCDRDMDVALKKFGFNNKMVWHNDNELPKSDLVVLPGGFSYGDYLRCGSMASKSKIMQSVINFAKSGGLVMGICNGFQILVETGLVPGVLLRNKYLEFICKNVFVKLDNKDNSYFKNLDKEILELKGEFSVLIVNDGSNEKMPETKSVYKNIKFVKVINMKKNQGHTRSYATGIRYLSKKENYDYLILMDGDGEDRPEEIKLLVNKVLKNEDVSVVAKRVKRSEGLIFSILYNFLFKILLLEILLK